MNHIKFISRKVLRGTVSCRHVEKAVWLFIGLISVSIIAFPNQASINYSPANPNVEQNVTFTVSASNLPNVATWDFGDGVAVSGGHSVNHTYGTAGTFLVKATFYLLSGAPISLSTSVTVTERRRIDFSPSAPSVNQNISFTAVNFFSTTLRWDYGDGSAPVLGGKNQIHAYSHSGSFIVAVKDFSGSSDVTITTNVKVKAEESITFSPNRPRAGEAVNFTAVNFASNTMIRWDFGDGNIMNDSSPPSISHQYSRAGTYLVRAYDGGGGIVTASVSVRVYAPALIRFSPADPRQGEEVSFEAVNFFSNSLIRWDFGDGSIENDRTPPRISHVYANPGSYMVRAFDGGGGSPAATLMLQVLPPRSIAVSPVQPRNGEQVVLTAVNFSSSVIRWEFGDGEEIAAGSSSVTHVYSKEGIYTVTAWDTRNGMAASGGGGMLGARSSQSISIPVTRQVVVVPARGPRAPFSISYINLRFEDGKSYIVVPRGFQPLMAYSEIKYEGTGGFYAQWIVDGSPVSLVNQSMDFSGSITIDSGRIPGLPTLIPGLHEVTLKIIQPDLEFNIPVIRYFVTMEETRDNLELDLSESETLNAESVKLAENFIKAPPNQHFLLKGKVVNENLLPLPAVLLRVYLDEELIDQKILRNLNPSEERVFETSIFNSSEDEKKIVILLFNISREPADLVYVRELNLVTEKK